ncbi:MAG: M15 family metallopeptidase [Miltoncostaeaceae bacterium]
MSELRPIPPMAGTEGWRDAPLDPVDEPLVAVAALHTRIHDVPRYHAAGLAGALPAGWVRRGVGERLVAALDDLPADVGLTVWDGYRPHATQSALFNTYVDELALVHPDWPADALEEAASRSVTPPSRTRVAPPPHLTGGAVDLTLCDRDGVPLDLGTDFDAFVPQAGARALEDVPGPARDNRRRLFWALSAQGFTNYIEEWWHYDLGNQFWGHVTGGVARYGPAPDPAAG